MTKIKLNCLTCNENKIFDMTKIKDLLSLIRYFNNHNIKLKITILDKENYKSKIVQPNKI